ncbi:hypothetical protein IJV57_05345 [Candidatus Saccharibacteria bacterium]|nr:hypothetical protein [Candidatus Saccharibacteria bacterium]
MVLVKNKEMTDLAFYYWINGFPTSGHPLDYRRFLGFILTERHYRCRRYNTFDKFKTECLSYTDKLTQSEIKEFWDQKQKIEDFLDDLINAEMPLEHEMIKGGIGYVQQNIINHQLYRTEITEEEYSSGGISHAEVKKRARLKMGII